MDGLDRQVWEARHDPLTALANPAKLTELGDQLAAIGDRVGLPVHLLRLRLSNLDRLSADFGEAIGDELLRAAASRLSRGLRAPDLAARLDGADFAVATLTSDPDTMALRLRAAVTGEPVDTAAGPLALELDSAHAPLKSVERAVAETARRLESGNRPNTASKPTWPDVATAISENRLSLDFQPIVHADTRVLHHFEALLRFRRDDDVRVSAFGLVTQAEQAGEIAALDLHVLSLAEKALRAHSGLHLAVNVSAGTAGDARRSSAYLEALGVLGELAGRVTLELTETMDVGDPGQAGRFSKAARALGCRFAVDDFASGHTSFRNLQAVDADGIKLDGSLVRGVALDESKQAFIRVMVDLASTFGMETVAEMIEDRADADVLARLGVTYLQGYYFGRPGPEPVWP
ncbi:MAG: GGDEF domain-containing phosphodiesterase [Litorimonas sp.]